MNILELAILKKMVGGGGGSGTDSYNDLSNLPKINDVTLSGNKSSSALGLQSEITSDSKLASDLVDDTNQDNKFVTSAEKTTWNGKQNAIDADHKINADYVDDSTSTNKFVTASDKETWNAKQNAIDNSHKLSSDLVDDANHTNKFVTSTEKQTWNAKQNAIDADHKLSSSLVSFSEAEAAAIASGIDSSKVGQISTNQSNILYGLDKVGTNCAGIDNATFTAVTDDRYLVIPCGNTLTGNIHIHLDSITSNDTNATTCAYLLNYTNGSSSNLGQFDRGVVINKDIDIGDSILASINIYPSNSYSNSEADTFVLTNFMVTSKAIWDQFPTFTPAALPNYDLTYLEAQDRAALAEEIDAGAKNKFDFANAVFTDVKATSTKTSTSITITADSNGDWSRSYTSINLEAGSYVFTTTISNYSKTVGTPVIYIASSATGGNPYGTATITGNGTVTCSFNIPTTGTYYLCYYVNDTATASGVSCSYTASNNMVATKAAFGVSSKFVPYRPNYDLVCDNLTRYKWDQDTTIGTDWTLTSIKLEAPIDAFVKMDAIHLWAASAPRGIRINRSNTSPETEIIATIEVEADQAQISIPAYGIKYYGVNTYYVWAKAKTTGKNYISLAYSYMLKN